LETLGLIAAGQEIQIYTTHSKQEPRRHVRKLIAGKNADSEWVTNEETLPLAQSFFKNPCFFLCGCKMYSPPCRFCDDNHWFAFLFKLDLNSAFHSVLW